MYTVLLFCGFSFSCSDSRHDSRLAAAAAAAAGPFYSPQCSVNACGRFQERGGTERHLGAAVAAATGVQPGERDDAAGAGVSVLYVRTERFERRA